MVWFVLLAVVVLGVYLGLVLIAMREDEAVMREQWAAEREHRKPPSLG